MPNQKGSLKDRLRSWRLFLKYKKDQRKKLRKLKKKQKKEIKEKQLLKTGKYYSKPKVFGLTILGLFLGLFEPKSKDRKINVEMEIVKLETKLKDKTIDIDDVKKIEQIDKVLAEKKQSNLNIGKRNVNDYIKRVSVIKENIKKQDVLEVIKSNTLKKKEDQSENQGVAIKNDEIKTNEEVKIIKKVYVPVLEIKQLNKDLEKNYKKIKDIGSKIITESEYNNLFDYEFEIKQLKLKIEDILVKYEILKQLPGFKDLENYSKIKDIDLYEIRKNDKKIKDKIDLCNQTLIQIEERKKEIIITKKSKVSLNKEPDKKEKIETKQKEVKKEPKKEENNQLFEITLANKIIYDNIAKEQRKVAKLERSLSKITIKRRRPTIFYYTKNLISSVFNLTFSLFPISMFKNKMLGGLVSGVMINNSLRSVRKILNPEVKISYIYENLEKEIASTSSYLSRMDLLLGDSLDQIKDIRQSVISKYGNDFDYQLPLASYLDELNKIENKIEFEREKVLGLHQDLDKVYKKNKQKVLIIERQNNYNGQ